MNIEMSSKQKSKPRDYSQYRDDPVKFGTEILGESYTDEVKTLMESVRDNEITIAISATGTGKCVHIDDRIPMADGRYVPAGDLIGKYFSVVTYGNDGRQYPELAWAEDNGRKPVYRVTSSGGRSIVRTEKHPLMSATSRRKYNTNSGELVVENVAWKPVDKLKEGDLVAVPTKLQAFSDVEAPDDHVKLLGYLLGDGGTTQSVVFTQQDGKAKDEFCEIVYRLGGEPHRGNDGLTVRVYGKSHSHFSKNSNPIINLAREWGIYGKKATQKCFPDFVWQLPDRQLALLLNRLMACDGWAYSRRLSAEIGICLSSERMVHDVQMAMLRLGICGSVRHRMIGGKFHAWVFTITQAEEMVKFSGIVGIYGKEEAVSACFDQAIRRNHRRIKWIFQGLPDGYKWETVKSVKYLGEHPTVAITVRDTHTYLTSFVEHNTHSAARIACWFKSVYGDDAQVLTAAAPPENNLKTILWGEIGMVVSKHPALFEHCTITSLKIEDSPKSFILGLTIPSSGTPAERESKFSGKHAPYLLFILDEGDAIPDEVYKGIEGCMSGGIVVRMLIMFNPKQESGEVYRMIRDGRANVVQLSAFAHPNVVSGSNTIPGAVTRETTIRRINQWCRPLAQSEPGKDFFTLPAYLEGCTAKSPSGTTYPPLRPGKYEILNSAFSYMVLGRYPAQSSRQLISREWINAARARWDSYVASFGAVAPRGVRPIMGQDVAEFGDDENVSLFRYGGWVETPVAWGGMERYAVANRARDEYRERDAYRCNVDASGIGIGIAPTMTSDGCAAYSVFVGKPSKQKTDLGEFGTIRDQLWWAVREWLQNDPGAMLPPDEMLIEELQCPTYKNDNRGKIKIMDKDTMREILKRSPDRADALCLTFAPSEQAFDPLDVDSCAA